ncbi:hypothetical protein O3P69_016368 [Scylla paramamosain]|uniref:C2H2-type domain-containing protein n=1 Tax=Scylla paramamosain TaxID=85552 RepID=A0AAW0TGA5_SCYPA
MASEEKILQVGEAQETPQAITITIVDPSTLGSTSLDPSLVASVEAQGGADPGSIVMVSGGGDSKGILQTVTETHMGTEELPIISNISNPEEEDEEEEETIVHETKLSESFDGGGDEGELGESFEEAEEAVGPHCLVCNIDLTSNDVDEQVPVFKTQTSTTQRRVAVFLSGLIGQKLTSRKAHSDILCRRCFSLLDRVDSLEVEIRETKEEIVNKYQETVSSYGGRARRRKPATAKNPDYVFPKVEPEDEADQLLDMELDGNFEPQVEDLMDEDPSLQDDDWEPKFKRPRIKKESTSISETSDPPKRKRGRPRKDLSKSKGAAASTPSRSRPSCTTTQPAAVPDEHSLKAEEGKGSWHETTATRRLPSAEAAASDTLDGRAPPPPLSKQCPVCFITYFTISDLRNHFKRIHSDVKSVKCVQCSEQIDGNIDVFLAHRKGHQCGDGATAGRGAKTRECRVCHKQVRASGYSHHMATHKPVSCPRCNTQVAQRNLKRHINYCHVKAVIYPCEDCSAVYHDASNLLSHRKRNHLGQEVRRHLCEVCGKKFITPSDLRTHVAGVHHNVKKFVCEYCGLSFKISSALMYHRRLHTGEKPHTCHVCERSFMKPNALAKHVRRVHGLEYHGKYRKRTKAPEAPSKGAASQGPANPGTPKCEGVTGSSLPEEEQGGPSSLSPTLKETAQQEAEDVGVRVAAVYSLGEGGVVQVVNLHTPQPIQNLTYYRPEDRAVARSYEAAAPLHAISYYRQDAEEQYTVAELLPPQNTHEPFPHLSRHRLLAGARAAPLTTAHSCPPRQDAGEASTEVRVSVKADQDTKQQGKTPRPPLCADPRAETQDSDVLASQLVDGSLTCGCGVKSTSETEHVEHVLTHVSGAFRCPQCDCSYTSSPLLARHQRLVHSPDAPRGRGASSSLPASRRGGDACRCGEAVGDLLSHASVHLTGREECPVCGIRLLTARALEVHVERKHSPFLIAFLKDEEAPQEGGVREEEGCVQPVRCDVCGKVVSTTSRLARHRYLHHSEHYPWPCAACTLAFPSPNARRLHICPNRRKKEGDESSTGQRHECSICSVVFKLAPSLRRHMRRSHGIESAAPFSCPVCTRAMTSRKALTDHLRCHRRQGFPCEFCGAKLKTVDSLNVHVNEIHTHVVRLQCKLCPQVFFSSGRLSYHMKRHHTDRRSYTNLCHLCGKAYPYPSELRLHLRSHRNERPYKCDQCHKTFLKQGDLTYHKRSHTGERPHKCPHCDARFPRPNTLRSHIRYQHRETADVGTATSAVAAAAAASTTTTTTTTTTIPTTTTSTSTTTTSVNTTITTTANTTATTAVTANSVATAITAASTNTTEAAASTTTVAPYGPGAPAADSAVSSAPYLTTVNAAAFPARPSAVAVMTVPGGVPRAPAPPTLVPVVEGQLVNTVVGGHMTEMQPVQYVQVDGLPAGQAVQAVPHTVQGVEYAEAATLPYQIVHLQILQ